MTSETVCSIPTTIQVKLTAGFRIIIIYNTEMFATDEVAEPCIIFDGTRKSQLAGWPFFPRSQFSHVCALNILLLLLYYACTMISIRPVKTNILFEYNIII